MNDKESKRLDLVEVNKAQNIILKALEINNFTNISCFGALSLLAISLAQDGEMDKFEFLKKISIWWDSIEKHKDQKGPNE